MVAAEDIAARVNRYLELVAGGTADQIVELFADDATVEDPVGGGEVHIGRHAIHGFYKNLEAMPRETELLALRVAGHEAAFMFVITVGAGEGRITSMKAYWSAEHVTPV